jgi:hypothetical protein
MKAGSGVLLPKKSDMSNKQNKGKKKSDIEINLQDIIDRKKTEKQALLKLLSFVEKEIKGKKLN